MNRRRRCPRMKRRRFPRRSHWRFGAALAGWEEEVDDHLILWRNKTTPETQLGPNRDTPATANVKRFLMGYKESARSKLEAMMFRWVIEDGCQERGERWKWFTMIEEVSHHVWRSVPRGKDNLGRMWEPLKILKGRAETTAGGWTGSMDGWFGQVQLLVRTTWWRIWPETNWIGVMIASLSKRENQIQTLEAWKGCVVQSWSPGLESLGGRRETKWILWIRARHRS